MALFENYEGRMPQLQPVLDKYSLFWTSMDSRTLKKSKRSPTARA